METFVNSESILSNGDYTIKRIQSLKSNTERIVALLENTATLNVDYLSPFLELR